MAMKAVEAVFFWRYGLSQAKAVYRRFPNSTEYSKDYLQSPASQWPIIDQVLGRSGDEAIDLIHRWPTGEVEGEWRKSAADNRGQYAWKPMSASPVPWRLGNPKTDRAVTFEGDPSATTAEAATAAINEFLNRGFDPWIIAVKLFGEHGVLHSRAYLGTPPAELASRSISGLPSFLRSAIESTPASSSAGAVTLTITEPRNRSPILLAQIKETLMRDPNVLLVGPPGTGKTVALEDLREQFLAEAGAVYFDPDLWDNNWMEVDSDSRKVVSLVFHPSYGYEDFVAGLMPSMDGGGGFSLRARPGPLVSLAHWAKGSLNRRALLIIDEFNRGATAAIFGDTIALLDRDKRSDASSNIPGASILRPYPRETMSVEESYRDENGDAEVSRELSLPLSVWVVAALNSSDRSVTPLDAALRRRFAIVPVRPDYAILADHLGIPPLAEDEQFTPTSENVAEWTVLDAKAFAIYLLKAVNARIEFLLSSDLLMGHALLWPVGGNSVAEVARSLGQAFDERIAAALRLTFVDQDEALAAVLKAGTADQPGLADANRLTRWSYPPPDMQGIGSPRLTVVPQGNREPLDILRSLRTLL